MMQLDVIKCTLRNRIFKAFCIRVQAIAKERLLLHRAVTTVCSRHTFPRNSIKSPTVFMAATRKAFSTRITKASFAEVQKLVLLIAVAVYAFWEKEIEDLFIERSGISDGGRGRWGGRYSFWVSHIHHMILMNKNSLESCWIKQYEPADRRLCEVKNYYSSPPLLIIYALTSLFKKTH